MMDLATYLMIQGLFLRLRSLLRFITTTFLVQVGGLFKMKSLDNFSRSRQIFDRSRLLKIWGLIFSLSVFCFPHSHFYWSPTPFYCDFYFSPRSHFLFLNFPWRLLSISRRLFIFDDIKTHPLNFTVTLSDQNQEKLKTVAPFIKKINPLRYFIKDQ